jgi:hypothetical protein
MSGDTAPGRTGSSIDGEYSTPTLRLALWPAWRVGKHKGAQTAIGPSQSPSRSLETARPVGRASALDFCPGAKVSGSQTDLPTPWYDAWAEIIPFRHLPVLLGGKGTSHVGRTRVTCYPREKNNGHRTPPGPCVPNGGTPEAPNRHLCVVAPGASQYPLTPSGWHALRAGV